MGRGWLVDCFPELNIRRRGFHDDELTRSFGGSRTSHSFVGEASRGWVAPSSLAECKSEEGAASIVRFSSSRRRLAKPPRHAARNVARMIHLDVYESGHGSESSMTRPKPTHRRPDLCISTTCYPPSLTIPKYTLTHWQTGTDTEQEVRERIDSIESTKLASAKRETSVGVPAPSNRPSTRCCPRYCFGG